MTRASENRALPEPTDPPLRLRGPAELAQAIPYLLGFHPRESLVLVGLAADRLVVTIRLDLADLDSDPPLLVRVVRAAHDGGATTLVGAVYDDEGGSRPATDLPRAWLVGQLRDACQRGGCTLADVLRVAGGRWWSYGCEDPRCCPDEGSPVPAVPSPFVAGATFAGRAVLRDRDALARTLTPSPEADRRRLGPSLAACRGRFDAGGAAAATALRSARRELVAYARAVDRTGTVPAIDDGRVARFGAALCVIAVRDELWLAIDAGRLDARELWREIARRLPAPADAVPLFLFGWANWRAGEGAIAAIAVGRALESSPEMSAARMLGTVLDHGVDPRRFPRLEDDRGRARAS